jgi:uncharacterized repeat protein (TIGR03803 family)
MNTRALKILAVGLSLCAAAGNLLGQVTLTNLYSFSYTGGSSSNGFNPETGLVQGSDGNFYGTTYTGGAYYPASGGTVFQITTNGSLTTLFSFNSFTNGVNPLGGLVQGTNGYFYGTTSAGGPPSNQGNGTVFRFSLGGTVTNLHTFGISVNDGRGPQAGLMQGRDGNFYGTTEQGGTNSSPGGLGTVFQITPNGDVTILHSFNGHPDGRYPVAGLVQGSDGNFYGTTEYGGTNDYGTVFQLNSTNGMLTILHSFTAADNYDAAYPQAGLVQGNDGNFYGTTYEGGSNLNGGVVFRISSRGSYTNLYTFTGQNGDGWNPEAGLVQGSDGNFYGTTHAYGANNDGTVFRISPSGSYSNLHSFSGTDGDDPVAGLAQGSDGNFYGTTELGGTNSRGNVFKLIVPLNPPANQISAIQITGTNVLVTIPSVAYEMYQLQFSSSMTPTNWVNQGGSVSNSLGALLTVTNFGGALLPKGFYRFGITP